MIKKRENAGMKHLNDLNINLKNSMDDVYEDIDDYKPRRKIKILILFDDTIADIIINKIFKLLWKNCLSDVEN